MNEKILTFCRKTSLIIFLGLLGYAPLHILLSTIFGVYLDVLPFAKVAKDIALVIGGVAVIVASLPSDWFKKWLNNKLLWLIVLYGVYTVFMALVRPTDRDAEILGVVYNTRFLLFFLYGWLLTNLYKVDFLRKTALKIILGVGALVVLFGIVQYTILPDDALTHLGFVRENGVLPVFFIDDKPNLERVMSTIRDPNSLGSYLIIIATLIGAMLLQAKRAAKKWWVLFGISTLLCLWFTFSRSAWLGMIAATAVFVVVSVRKYIPKIPPLHKRIALTGIIIVGILGAGSLYIARDNYFIQNVIFHADQSTVLEDPNELRLRFWRESLEGVANDPLGSGPGTAGLASIKNEIQGMEMNENYYLQIASEVGIVGVVLFLAILVIVGAQLYRGSIRDPVAAALLASFVGLAITNFLLHIWANEAVAYTWWGLAGLYMYNNIRAKTKPSKIKMS